MTNKNVPEKTTYNLIDTKATNIIEDAVLTDDVDELKNLTAMFNLNMAKKNMIRVLKLNGLLDELSDVAIKRLQKPDEITNKELLDYLSVIQGLIEKSSKTMDTVNTAPVIQINTQNNTLIQGNAEIPQLSQESRDRVLSVVEQIRKMIDNKEVETNDN